MYLTVTTTACCYSNFSLRLKQRPYRGLILTWMGLTGSAPCERLHAVGMK